MIRAHGIALVRVKSRPLDKIGAGFNGALQAGERRKTMPFPEIELLEDDLDDGLDMTSTDLGIPIDLARADLDDDDDLGLRALYEHPEAVLGESALRPSRWGRAA
jgi:hypothetical protein